MSHVNATSVRWIDIDTVGLEWVANKYVESLIIHTILQIFRVFFHVVCGTFALYLPDRWQYLSLPSVYQSCLDIVDSFVQLVVSLVGLIGPFTLAHSFLCLLFFEVVTALLIPLHFIALLRMLMDRNSSHFTRLFSMICTYSIMVLMVGFGCGLIKLQEKFNGIFNSDRVEPIQLIMSWLKSVVD